MSITAPVVGALEAVWSGIRSKHPEVPEAVVVLASGSERGQLRKYGHFASLRWRTKDGQRPEVLIAGEGLDREPESVLGTLIHEAAHAVAEVRGVQDTSRQGRYHNQHYRALALELGLEVVKESPIGWSRTSVPATTVSRYEHEVQMLADALTLYRIPEASGPSGTGKSRSLLALCGCERKIRIARRTLVEGPILCGLCEQPFELQEVGDGGEAEAA